MAETSANNRPKNTPLQGHSPESPRSMRTAMPYITPGQVALSTIHFLPVPILVLNSLKVVILANEALGRLFGMYGDADEVVTAPILESLHGQSLSQVGVDMVQDGRPVWISWEQFLDSLVFEKSKSHRFDQDGSMSQANLGGMNTDGAPDDKHDSLAQKPGQNAVVEVIISRTKMDRQSRDSKIPVKTAAHQHRAKMIITVWEVDHNQTYFTLTFTNTDSDFASTLYPISRKSIARASLLEAAERRSISSSTAPSVNSADDIGLSPDVISPSAVSLSSSPFPPLGPPARLPVNSAPSILQKTVIMKDALIDSTEAPILAMWKDGSVTLSNKAAQKLFSGDTNFDEPVDGSKFLSMLSVWDEDFTTKLDPSEFPISVLLRTETPFSGRRYGMYDADGNRRVFEAEGELIQDEVSGEVLAGVVTSRDVTKMTQMIIRIKEEDEERFKIICDAMPQLVWTTTPEGSLEFFNQRWYEYTGLTQEASIGRGWMTAIHPEDGEEFDRLFQHSLRTGEPFVTEYRCRSKDGEWKWFITRALPLRSKENGRIEKWLGTCTDANESIESRREANRTRQQLLTVIAHARVTVFQVDTQRRITMLEGALIEEAFGGHDLESRLCIGQDVYSVWSQLKSTAAHTQHRKFLEPIETIIAGHQEEILQEDEFKGRFYRTRFLPVGKKDKDGQLQSTDLEGVIGVIMDVTELKSKEADIEAQTREKRQLMASEAAAKEASKLKSQFLANMSHEIRTPITGVIGMAELLLDLDLGDEQREYTENIYRSANALLTVINDILDFSKVESGRLDIEEVQFSLSIIIHDVNKMLSFAAERKNLDFLSEVPTDITDDMAVMGDPGRVRQIITNLLTNSIKFTNQGYVKFSVAKEKEDSDTVEIKFVIEDTGIGIEEDVRKRLFQPFSQGDPSTARKFGGTGLGLTICKSLLELMNGRMTLESNMGSGTTATFWIPFNKPHSSNKSMVRIDPLSERLQSDLSVSGNSSEYDSLLSNNMPTENAGSGLLSGLKPSGSIHRKTPSNPSNLSQSVSASDGSQGMPVDRSNIHILVVEDNAINQQIATKTIQKLGFTVAAAWNGREALDYLAAAQEGRQLKPSIILMDVQMPVIDGYKCTHLLRHHLPYKTYVQNVPIVAMTASAIQGDKEKCRKAGMDDYLAKPVRSKILEKMLDRWTRKRPRLDEALFSQGSDLSECSNAGEHCDNVDIPCVEHDDKDFMDLSQLPLEAILPADNIVANPRVLEQHQQLQQELQPQLGERQQPPISMANNPVKPTLTRSETEETQLQPVREKLVRNDSTQTTTATKRTGSKEETDRELAAQSRDDKLFDAADARDGIAQERQLPHSLEPSTSGVGEALTMANMAVHDREEADKLMRS